MVTIIVIILLAALLFGGLGYNRFGYMSGSPLLVFVAIILLLWAVGILR